MMRATRVPTAELLRAPFIRSPSQWPGTARVAISAGRAAIGVMWGIWPRRSVPRARGQRALFRSGSVNAAVWENTGETGPFFSVTFSRPYKDTQGHWKTSSSYALNDLDALSSLAELAKDWVRRHSPL